jgi:hypothetical protein
LWNQSRQARFEDHPGNGAAFVVDLACASSEPGVAGILEFQAINSNQRATKDETGKH